MAIEHQEPEYLPGDGKWRWMILLPVALLFLAAGAAGVKAGAEAFIDLVRHQ